MNQSPVDSFSYYRDARIGPRNPFKTLVICFLLILIPLVGWSMATMYFITRNHQERYDAGSAAGAGFALMLITLVGYVVVVAIIGFFRAMGA